MPLWGYDFPQGRVAVQTLSGAVGAGVVLAHRRRQGVSVRRALGRDQPRPLPSAPVAHDLPRPHYGLASQDIKGGAFDVLAQWVRAPKTATRMDSGGAFRPHAIIHAKVPLRRGHFERWLWLWRTTVDELFAGPRAELAKAHAARVAAAFHGRLDAMSAAADASDPARMPAADAETPLTIVHSR